MVDARTFNLLECGLWLIISAILIGKSFVDKPRQRFILRILAITFVAFGFSDYVEAQTGAWWKPLWLLCLKGGCIIIFILGFRGYHRLAKELTH